MKYILAFAAGLVINMYTAELLYNLHGNAVLSIVTCVVTALIVGITAADIGQRLQDMSDDKDKSHGVR